MIEGGKVKEAFVEPDNTGVNGTVQPARFLLTILVAALTPRNSFRSGESSRLDKCNIPRRHVPVGQTGHVLCVFLN